MDSILILGSGTQGLAAVSSLKHSGYRVVLLCPDKNNYADKSRCVDKLFNYDPKLKDDEIFNTIVKILVDENIKAVLPMGDGMAEFLCKHKDDIEKHVAKIGLPSLEVFYKGYDKNQLMTLCAKKGYPHPETIDMSVVALSDDALKNFYYPALLKPNCTTGGRGMKIVNSYEEMKSVYDGLRAQYGDYHLQRFVRAGGRQVKIQILLDEKGDMVCSSVLQKVRWYPVKGGSSCCNISIESPDDVNVCYNILKDIGWNGFADFDLIEDPDSGKLLVMEINPRLPACIKGAIAAGINWPEIIVNYILDRPQKVYKYTSGMSLRHLGLDTLWFFKSPNRWKTKPSWFKFFGKNVSYQDMNGWSDPMPFIAGTFNNMKKIFSGKK